MYDDAPSKGAPMKGLIRMSLRLVLAVAVVVLVGGCVHVSDDGKRQVIDYAVWVPLGLLVGCLAAGGLGWSLRNTSQRLGFGLILAGFMLLVIGVPSLFRDRITIDEHRFTMRTGIWGLSAVHSVDFDRLTGVRIVIEQETDSRGRERTHRVMLCQSKNGTIDKLPWGNAMCEAAEPYIVKTIKERGISFRDER
jgi:hypothetical protein